MMRPATVQDCETLAQLNARCHTSHWSAKQFQAACQSEHDRIFIKQNEKTGECLGFIVWQTLLDEMELHLIATAPEHRRQGIARTLINMMLDTAQQQPTKRIFLEVRDSNFAAQQLYAQHGFVATGRRKNYYDGHEDAILMEKSME